MESKIGDPQVVLLITSVTRFDRDLSDNWITLIEHGAFTDLSILEMLWVTRACNPHIHSTASEIGALVHRCVFLG